VLRDSLLNVLSVVVLIRSNLVPNPLLPRNDCVVQTCYQSGQSDINQAAAQIWQAGALSLT
jgi:hypothetical protein